MTAILHRRYVQIKFQPQPYPTKTQINHRKNTNNDNFSHDIKSI